MKSRFIHTTKARPIRHRKSRYLPMAEEATKRFIKCWHCGFIIDTELGLSPGDGSGVSVGDRAAYTDEIPPKETRLIDKELSAISTRLYWDSPFMLGLLCENGPDGTPASIYPYTPRVVDIASGTCPLCGTRNLP